MSGVGVDCGRKLRCVGFGTRVLCSAPPTGTGPRHQIWIVRKYTCTYTWMHDSVYLYTYTVMYVSICMCMCLCVWTCVYMFSSTVACMFGMNVYTYTYGYVHMYV
jgi:hypothetical protein